jgi:hypothetical protein
MKRPLRFPCHRFLAFLAFLLPILSVAAQGQSLRLAYARPASAACLVEILLDSPAGKAPVALQWETTLESVDLTFVQDALPLKPNAVPGKSIRCAPKSKTAGAQTFVCMLAGGVDPIPNGAVARLQLTRASGKSTTPVRVRIDQAIGVYKDLRRVSMKPVELVAPAGR